MRFKKIIVENFGPFKSPAIIDFKDRDGVSIVWGFNGRGKTTLLNAFNFVLNGTVKDRDGNVDNFVSYINEAGKSEGKYTFKVILDLLDGTKKYRVIRSLQVMPGVSIPETNADVFVDLKVNEDGNVLSPADSEHFVKNIINKEVSRFFLFDGELLTEYEELLNENSETGGSIKKSIEQILGMPILTYGASDARDVASYIATEARKVAQNEKTVSKYTKMLNEESDKLYHQEKELARLTGERDALITHRNQLNNIVNDTEKIRQFLSRKREIEVSIAKQEETCESEKQAIAELLPEAWKWMIAPTVKSELERISIEIKTLHEKEKASESQKTVIAFIKKAIEDVYCPVCEHEVTSAEKQKLNDKITNFEELNSGLTKDEKNRLLDLKKQEEVYAKHVGAIDFSSEIKNHYKKYITAKVKSSDLKEHDLKEAEDDIASLKKSAVETDEKKVFEYLEKLGKTIAEITVYDNGISELKDEIETTNSNISKLNNTIISKSKNKDVVLANKKVAFAESIASIFGEGIGVYRDKLSKDVEKDATDIFMAMNTEEDYGGLQINKNYGLTIVRKSDGLPVPKRSAGWEHMVAFALIGALHKNAPFDGPVIMDSPFYRLDNKNTASMVRALPMIAHQVLMFPYPGEIDPSSTRNDIGSYIVQELEIARISSNESTIKELSKNG